MPASLSEHLFNVMIQESTTSANSPQFRCITVYSSNLDINTKLTSRGYSLSSNFFFRRKRLLTTPYKRAGEKRQLTIMQANAISERTLIE